MATTEQQQRESIHSQIHHLGHLTARLEDLYQDLEGEVTDATESLETFLEEHADETLEALVWYLKELEGTGVIVAAELDRLSEIKRRTAKREDWAKDLLRDLLNLREVRKAKAGTFVVSLAKSPHRLVGESEPALLPDCYVREVPARREVAKDAIKKALKAKVPVEGFSLQRGPDRVVVK